MVNEDLRRKQRKLELLQMRAGEYRNERKELSVRRDVEAAKK